MLPLILAMLFCGAVGAGVVGYVLVEARREGRGEFWTAEGEELIAGARRAGEKVVSRGESLASSAAERTRELKERLPERKSNQQSGSVPEAGHPSVPQAGNSSVPKTGHSSGDPEDEQYLRHTA